MRLKDEKGIMAIGGAVMLIVVLPLLATALWQYSMLEVRQVAQRERELKALYLARAGAEAAMNLWMDKPISERPVGRFARVYYDAAAKQFTLNQPAECFGYFDVEIRYIDDPGNPKHLLTEIVSTAVVEGVTRSITVTTYPFHLGHELGWYSKENGIISYSNGVLFDRSDGLVRVVADQPVRFQANTSPDAGARFSANMLMFEQALNLAYNQTTDYYLLAELAIRSKALPIEAETIFFEDVVMLKAPANYGLDEVTYSVVLSVPPGMGVEPPPGHSGSRWGLVFFDGDRVGYQNYRWERKSWLLIFWRYRLGERANSFTSIVHPEDGRPLAGRAFYFRSGMNLLNPQPGDLIPLTEEVTRRDLLKQIHPFVWE